MANDLDDPSFMQGMHDMFGMDDEQIEQLLDKLDAESLASLTDAVAKQDKQAAQEVIQSFEADDELNALVRTKDEKDDKRSLKPKKTPVPPPKGHQFGIGDDVAIKDDDDSFVTATVFKPRAPGNTIGVKVDGKLKMVDKDKVYVLKEMVLGMIGVPNLQRMQQLAGIQSNGELPVIQQPVIGQQNDDAAAAHAMRALDELEQVLPQVRLADLKDIRQRLIDLQRSINEGCIPRLRK